MLTKIQKWGNSQAVRIPKKILQELSIKPEEEIELIVKDETIIIKKPAKKYSNLDELFAGYDGDYKCEEYNTGEPVGKEVW